MGKTLRETAVVIMASLRKSHPAMQQVLNALKYNTAAPPAYKVAGNKDDPMYRAINAYLYGKSRRGGGGTTGRRLVEPFMGSLAVPLAVRAEEGYFGNDKDQLLVDMNEMMRDNPEALAFDPKDVLYRAGDEPKLYSSPVTGSKLMHTLPEITAKDIEEARTLNPNSVHGDGVYMPQKIYELRAKVNQGLPGYQAGDIGTQDKEELMRNVLGLSRGVYNSIFRTNKQGLVNSAAGAKSPNPTLPSYARRAADFLEDETGKRKYGTSSIEAGPRLSAPPLNLFSGGGNLEMDPWDVTPWSKLMENWAFTNDDFGDFYDRADIAADKDIVGQDPPYGGGEEGQHIWSDELTGKVYDKHKELAEQGTPTFTYNSATKPVIDAINERGLPLSILMARHDKLQNAQANQAGSQKTTGKAIKPESLVVSNVPGVTSNFMEQFIADKGWEGVERGSDLSMNLANKNNLHQFRGQGGQGDMTRWVVPPRELKNMPWYARMIGS
tara:strand:- start:5789 stop:7273 length:1485 start_codon:yes stop_codon:yes gene_type:complete